jgi:hypothetical protein
MKIAFVLLGLIYLVITLWGAFAHLTSAVLVLGCFGMFWCGAGWFLAHQLEN